MHEASGSVITLTSGARPSVVTRRLGTAGLHAAGTGRRRPLLWVRIGRLCPFPLNESGPVGGSL